MTRTESYTKIVGYEHRKKYAQFFTPSAIAKFMVEWVAKGSSSKSVFDPAFGLGAFFENAPKGCEFTGCDIDSKIIEYFKQNAERKPDKIECADYLLSFGERRSGIVCNPPYLRFQKFMNRSAVFSAFNDWLGVRLSGYTNIASAFLVKSISELTSDGRLAYILPSEFLNAGYGELVKQWLVRGSHLDSIIEVACEKDAFEEVITSVCIVLYDAARKIDAVSFRKVESMDDFSSVLRRDPISKVKALQLDAKAKWGVYFTRESERAVPNRELLQPLSAYGHFSRGIATGANEFFVLSKGDKERLGLSDETCVPCVTKSCQLTKRTFSESDLSKLIERDNPVYLFSPGEDPDVASLNYIHEGERRGYHDRFITRHRKPWYKTESREIAPLLLNVFSRTGYKIVRNYSSALSLTNFHCFYPNGFGRKYVDWLFLYLDSGIGRRIVSLSKRKYGNALDKFEPNDLNAALVPKREFFDSIGEIQERELMNAVKSGEDVAERLDEIFEPLLSEVGEPTGTTEMSLCFPDDLKPVQMLLAVERKKAKTTARQRAKGLKGARIVAKRKRK